MHWQIFWEPDEKSNSASFWDMEKQLHQDIRSVNSRHFAAETKSRSGENIERQDNGLEDDEPRFIFLG